MQVTIDIPDPLYRVLERRASATQKSVEETLLLEACASLSTEQPFADAKAHRVHLPVVSATVRGTINLNQNLNNALFDNFDPS